MDADGDVRVPSLGKENPIKRRMVGERVFVSIARTFMDGASRVSFVINIPKPGSFQFTVSSCTIVTVNRNRMIGGDRERKEFLIV
jgi:hypothetical protein